MSSETSATVIVTPADGPSFGIGARGHVHVEVAVGEASRVDAELVGVRPHVA